MQSFLIMAKDDNGYHALQFQVETEKEIENFNLLKKFVKNQEIGLNRLLTPYEIEFHLEVIENELQWEERKSHNE